MHPPQMQVWLIISRDNWPSTAITCEMEQKNLNKAKHRHLSAPHPWYRFHEAAGRKKKAEPTLPLQTPNSIKEPHQTPALDAANRLSAKVHHATQTIDGTRLTKHIH